MIVFMVALGGAVGSVVRYYTTLLSSHFFGLSFPYGTFIVNIFGSFLIGLAFAFFESNAHIPPYWKAGIIAGFLGGLTTFSSFSFDTLALLAQEAYLKAVLNIATNTVLGLAVAGLGYYSLFGGVR